ncbi:MAG: phosphate butyryltransferase [Oscillospiraceae bacterium]|jgi:phosphate butyryltransferase|nr:phosphate butyryltransferase [Oscillospiraceae bacterium]
MILTRLAQLDALALEKAPARRAVVVASHEEHILKAASLSRKKGIVSPVLIGNAKKTEELLRGLGESPGDYAIVPCDGDAECVEVAVELVKKREADFIIKGLIETADLMRPLLNKEKGIVKPGACVSSIALIESAKYHKLFAMTDMGINTFPDLERKKQIINNAVWFMRRMGAEKPKVAVLSSVEHVNPKQEDTVEADALKKLCLSGDIPDCIVEGPISLDLAVKKETAAVKRYDSPVAGDADILMVPNILAGNLLIKGMGIFGDISTADAVLGFDVPVVFGSRGGPVEAKCLSIALCALIS